MLEQPRRAARIVSQVERIKHPTNLHRAGGRLESEMTTEYLGGALAQQRAGFGYMYTYCPLLI